MTPRAEELLAEPIRRSLWRMGWQSLRPLQQSAIQLVLSTKSDAILSAQTAAGKTEAAFLPILSQICAAPVGSVRALYIGPLKALINDQFRRLEDLCDYAEIPVHRWHGDVSSDKKRKLIDRPGGVLLITPESLESLFVNKSSSLARLFHSLSFVVIDELHAMLGNERGTQLRSQLFRLQRYTVERTRLLALSATIGDLPAAAKWMRPDQPDGVAILRDDSVQKAIRYRLHAYLSILVLAKEGEVGVEPANAPPDQFYSDVYENFRGSKNLIFANSKAKVEELTDRLNEMGKRNATGEEFLIHHGALSRDVREDTERLMQGDRPYTTICSSSLELGIDIGNVRSVGQIAPPWSVSSMLQRLGRSGRGDGESHQMRVFVIEDRPGIQSGLDERLYPELLQAAAITELMLEHWVESPNTQPNDFSTLVQQTLSLIAELGGAQAARLYEILVNQGAFRFITQPQFVMFLRSLAQHDLIEQQPDGLLILGLVGEQIVRHYDFYAAFIAPPEYRVVHGSRLIGRLSATAVPRPSDHLLLAGRRWQVLAVDDRSQEISVQPASGRKPPYFPSGGGDIDSRIRQKMRDVLRGETLPTYLDSTGAALLRESREVAKQIGLCEADIVPCGLKGTVWFPWTGTRTMRTLHLMFDAASISVSPQRSGLSFTFPVTIEILLPQLQQLINRIPTSEQMIEQAYTCERRKWDRFVCPQLLAEAYIRDELDVGRAIESLADVIATAPKADG